MPIAALIKTLLCEYMDKKRLNAPKKTNFINQAKENKFMVYFGPSGNSESFYNEGYKSSLQMPKWLKREKGLDAYEYQCSKGVKNHTADCRKKLGNEAREKRHKIKYSRTVLH
ncbi:MAG: hypothetical protein L6V93_06290 [Clostridiales bacterium]|nr:MAG: hypothetical protein L6V93_06290 [Clostridiales bacterium]